MSANKKKNYNQKETEEMEINCSSDDDDSISNEPHPDAYTGNEQIQVDFEGRSPIDSDLDGIRQLLHQLFLKAHINLAELSEVIIGQNFIGSVVIQSDMDEDNDDDDDMSDSNVIFGITTAINITKKSHINSIQNIHSFIIEKAQKHASPEIAKEFYSILTNDEGKFQVGFLINERFINIPAQISLPLLESLCKEIKKANEKKMDYNFTHFLMLIKFYRKEAKKGRPSEDIYTNEEEEIFCEKAFSSFEFSVQSESDTGISGQWLENDNSLVPFRKVILFNAEKLTEIVAAIKEFVKVE